MNAASSPANVQRYNAPAIALHWLVALLMIGSFTLGFVAVDMKMSPDKLRYFSWHKWVGVSIFLLAVLRLGWRLIAPPPALPAMPAWEKRGAEISHHLLYLCLLAMPLTGWLMSSAKGFTTVYFGVLPLPNLLDKNPPLGEALAAVHDTLAWLLLALIALHVAAAFKHHFIDRDEVLARMLPGLKAPSKE